MLPFSLYPLDKKFIGPKPLEQAPLQTLRELEATGNLILQRKRCGYCSYTVFGGPDGVNIYSVGINQLSERLPMLVEQLRAHNLPKGTLIAGEVLVSVNGVDDLGAFGAIAKSNVEKAIAIQRNRPVQLAIFNIIAHKGKSVIQYPYQDRLELLGDLFGKTPTPSVHVIQPLAVGFDIAKKLVAHEKWEGLVAYSKTAVSEFRTDGVKESSPRPDGCWKWKPFVEGDFVAVGWVPSTSKTFMGQVKDLLIAQYHPHTGELVNWGRVGVGLNSEQRKRLANNALYPLVVEVKFECRTRNTRLISARVMRERFDKTPKECITPLHEL